MYKCIILALFDPESFSDRVTTGRYNTIQKQHSVRYWTSKYCRIT